MRNQDILSDRNCPGSFSKTGDHSKLIPFMISVKKKDNIILVKWDFRTLEPSIICYIRSSQQPEGIKFDGLHHGGLRRKKHGEQETTGMAQAINKWLVNGQ